MSLLLQADAPPLREDSSGALRVGNTRVLLELVLRAFQDGATPEAIVQRYSTVTLSDVYAVISYYLRHRNEVEAYMAQREQKANEVWERIDRQQPDLSDIVAKGEGKMKPNRSLRRSEENGAVHCFRTIRARFFWSIICNHFASLRSDQTDECG